MLPAAGNTIHIGIVTGEGFAALRSQPRRQLDAGSAAQAIAEFSDDWATLYDVVTRTRQVINQAMLLAQRHDLRGYDTIQLASALEVGALARPGRDMCTSYAPMMN